MQRDLLSSRFLQSKELLRSNNRMVCTEERGETKTWSPAHLMARQILQFCPTHLNG